MDLQLHGKTAVVTGSTAGIGLAIASLLTREGATVIINGRTQERVDEAVHRIGASNNVRGIAADLATAAGVDEFVRQVPQCDMLVNNLGIFEPKPFEEISDADWFRFFETNVMSGVRLSRAYLPGMRERDWGRIIFISSESGLQNPGGDDPLRHDEDGADRDRARAGRDLHGHGRDGECGPARADGVGRREGICRLARGAEPADAGGV
jgi:NAD(P)-dependent dehydrogenase (short-subunit alcohol dehydrogenase family)